MVSGVSVGSLTHNIMELALGLASVLEILEILRKFLQGERQSVKPYKVCRLTLLFLRFSLSSIIP